MPQSLQFGLKRGVGSFGIVPFGRGWNRTPAAVRRGGNASGRRIGAARAEFAVTFFAYNLGPGDAEDVELRIPVIGGFVVAGFEAPAGWRVLWGTNEILWNSQRDDWSHLYLYDLTNGRLKHQVTSGPGPVTRILHVDEKVRLEHCKMRGAEYSDHSSEDVYPLLDRMMCTGEVYTLDTWNGVRVAHFLKKTAEGKFVSGQCELSDKIAVMSHYLSLMDSAKREERAR